MAGFANLKLVADPNKMGGGGSKTSCPICGNVRFGPGPNGRSSTGGSPPHCTRCGALERHRIARAILQRVLDPGKFSSYAALQFSNDPIVLPGWFRSFERSLFGGQNSMDLQRIPRKSGSYNIIICCHVIEHVADHRLALQNLVRILNRDGFLYLAYPNPITRRVTHDWGYPDPHQHGHYRIFGKDFEAQYRLIIPGVTVVGVTGTDRVTGAIDLHYIATKSEFWKARIVKTLPGARLVA